MISVASLSYRYSSGTEMVFPDFDVAPNEHVLLLGQSGRGKTTLLHLIGGLLRNYSGSIQVDSRELSSISETDLDKFRGRKIGFVFQRNHLITALSVEKNLAMSPYLAGLPVSFDRIKEVLAELNLFEKRHSRISELSQGEAQRVAIARAILNKPRLLLADEPTSALDDVNCDRVVDLLFRAATLTHTMLIVATHDQRLKDRITKQIRLS